MQSRWCWGKAYPFDVVSSLMLRVKLSSVLHPHWAIMISFAISPRGCKVYWEQPTFYELWITEDPQLPCKNTSIHLNLNQLHLNFTFLISFWSLSRYWDQAPESGPYFLHLHPMQLFWSPNESFFEIFLVAIDSSLTPRLQYPSWLRLPVASIITALFWVQEVCILNKTA